jgi:hypothetical protein
MTAKTQMVKVAMPIDLIELLEQEAKEYDSFTKMLNAVCRRYFIHQELKKEFAKIK